MMSDLRELGTLSFEQTYAAFRKETEGGGRVEMESADQRGGFVEEIVQHPQTLCPHLRDLASIFPRSPVPHTCLYIVPYITWGDPTPYPYSQLIAWRVLHKACLPACGNYTM